MDELKLSKSQIAALSTLGRRPNGGFRAGSLPISDPGYRLLKRHGLIEEVWTATCGPNPEVKITKKGVEAVKASETAMSAGELKETLQGLFGRSWRRKATAPPPDGLGIAVSSLNRWVREEDPTPIPGPVIAAVVAWKRLEDRLRAERARSTRRRTKGGDHG